MLVKIMTRHVSNSLVMFVTHKQFAVLFFLPSCCINSLIILFIMVHSIRMAWIRIGDSISLIS